MRRFCLGVAALCLVQLIAAPARAELHVALLDPDANLANIARLRAKVGTFLRTVERKAVFSTFTRIADLRRRIGSGPVHFVLINDAAAEALVDVELRPVLVPLRDGRTTHYKVFVVRRGTEVNSVRVVATTASSSEVDGIVLSGRQDAAPRMMVLRVSKGIDALLGLAFDRADAAYVTPETLAQLGRVDEELAASLEEVYRSPPLPNPRLYAVGDQASAELTRRVVDAFLTMATTSAGREALNMLDYDGWKAVP